MLQPPTNDFNGGWPSLPSLASLLWLPIQVWEGELISKFICLNLNQVTPGHFGIDHAHRKMQITNDLWPQISYMPLVCNLSFGL